MVIEKYYVYKYYDKDDNLLYVGKTKQEVIQRWHQHRGCEKWQSEVRYILYAECNNEVDMCLYEVYYINKLRPKYNKASYYSEAPTVEMKDLLFDGREEIKTAEEWMGDNINMLRRLVKIDLEKTWEELLPWIPNYRKEESRKLLECIHNEVSS